MHVKGNEQNLKIFLLRAPPFSIQTALSSFYLWCSGPTLMEKVKIKVFR